MQDRTIGQADNHSTCSGYDCDWCLVRCPHCRARLLRTRLGVLSCANNCVIHIYDLWPGALERIQTMFAERRRDNLLRTKQQKRFVSERDSTDAWNADRYVPMNYDKPSE